ncbi:dihydroneopterin aldolase [Wolbachia endosymbiont of Oedothorax gibbosus]|uniref:dihydroneopterin aldolase n=1 Tax=Wolbachia endosymbiont of Oedothorax gibbosus TaxID=931100 RepID=UPI0020242CBB|nr:dihydroneopterin aldolase [Wolbachia endosymbiont of Oedothorax gibbosus]
MQCNLLISDLRLWVHLGCSAEEKFSPQLVSIDVGFTFKSPPLGLTTDQLKDTLCYLEVVRNIQYFVQGKQFNLIEHLTHGIHRMINDFLLQKKHTISSIRVTTHKVTPPVPGVHGGVFFTYCSALQEQ